MIVHIAIVKSAPQQAVQTLNISGTLFATSIGKYKPSMSGLRSFGFAIAVVMIPKMNAPKPYPQRMQPVTVDLLLGNHSQAHITGTK